MKRTIVRALSAAIAASCSSLAMVPGCANLVGIEELSGDGRQGTGGSSGTGGATTSSSVSGAGGTAGGGGGVGGSAGNGGMGGAAGGPSCPDLNGCDRAGLAVGGEGTSIMFDASFAPGCVRLRPVVDTVAAATFVITGTNVWDSHSVVGGTSDGISTVQKDPFSPITITLEGAQGTLDITVDLPDTQCAYPYYCEFHHEERGVIYVDPQMP